MEIVSVDKKHISDIVQLEAHAFNGQGEDIYTLAMIAEVGWVFLALGNMGQLTGAIEIVPTKKPEQGFIHGLVVEPEFQGNGVGAELIKYAENSAQKQGFSSLACTIAPWNGPSLNAFINKSCFQGVGFSYDYYGPGEHRLWVEKELGTSSPPTKSQGVQILQADQFDDMHELINQQGYVVNGVVRPNSTGHMQNGLSIYKP